MAQHVNRRRYDSPHRRQQANATRREILRAAQQQLELHGYAATTMADIAAEAGVALKTVYVNFDTKSGVVRGLWDVLLRGEADIPVADHPWFREVIDEPDPRRKLALNARNSRAGKERIGSLFRIIRGAAPVDGDIGALWAHIQTDYWANQRLVVQLLADSGALRPELTVDRATDILWTLVHPDVWLLLVDGRSWTPAEYERWLTETSCAQLLAQG